MFFSNLTFKEQSALVVVESNVNDRTISSIESAYALYVYLSNGFESYEAYLSAIIDKDEEYYFHVTEDNFDSLIEITGRPEPTVEDIIEFIDILYPTLCLYKLETEVDFLFN